LLLSGIPVLTSAIRHLYLSTRGGLSSPSRILPVV
jgi:hypothetical protein